ncbi:MAG: ATP-binding protein [Myxococcota bacterium]
MAASALQDRRVIESLVEGLVVHDASGAIIDFNQRALEVLGLSADQLRGRQERDPRWRLMRPDSTALPEAEIPSVEARTTRRPVLRRRLAVMRPNGEVRSLVVSAVPSVNAEGVVERVVALFSDVTEELARDRELEETRRFVELSNDVLVVVSAVESVILHINDGSSSVFGLGSSALVGRRLLELIHPEDVQSLALGTRTTPLHNTALRIRHADGSWRWLAVSATLQDSPVWGRVWFARGVDVSDLRRHAEELSRSRQQLADAQEIAHLGTWEADGARRTFTLSGRLRGLLGLGAELEPVTLETLVACFTVEERGRVKEALERALTGEAVSLQTRARGADGDIHELRLWTRARPQGSDARLFGVVQDISEQVRLNAKLQLTERMASIGTLAAGVAHEINNPLSYVLSNLTVALSELQRLRTLPGTDAQELIAALSEAKDGAERVKQIVSDLRTFARVDEQRRVPCDVAQVVSAALNMARNETRHRAQVVTHFEPTGPVLANEARLGQVFLNLIVNAAQAIPDGEADQNSITVTVREQGASIHVSVKDTGSGIAPEHLPRIFDPFFSTKAVGEGTGLGLFIAQNIVRDLGGDLSVDSTPGLGTTFDVRLPAAVVPWQGSAPSPAPVTRGATLLVVDDEPLLLKALGRMLGRGHTLTLVGSGREALELLEAGKRYDAVLCDMMMPDVSGLDVWERLGELDERQRRRLIFMTGGTFTERARRFLDEQRPPMLEKPFTASAFATLLAQLIAQSD